MELENTTKPFVTAGASLAQMKWAATFETIAEEDCVVMSFPRDVLLTLDSHQRRVFFPSGLNLVPKSWAGLPYLIASGATRA